MTDHTTHLDSIKICGPAPIFLTARHNGCITLDGKPSIQWSITTQEHNEIKIESPIGEDLANEIYTRFIAQPSKSFLTFEELVADYRGMVIEIKKTSSVSEAMKTAFNDGMG